jgi:prevent-host-death family protein
VSTVGAYDAKTHLPRLLDEVERGETVTITKHGRELANVLLVAERRGRLSEAQAVRFVGLLDQLPIRIDPAFPDPTAVLGAGRRYALSAYPGFRRW